MFELNNVTKEYNGEFALNQVSMTIGKGMNFIVGASGSGKTTLLKIISGLEQEFGGEVFYCGKPIREATSRDKSYFYHHEFGFVCQDFNLREDYTVLENLLLPQFLNGTPDQKSAQRILRELKIADLASKKCRLLSGGQKQRVAIARELMKNPRVILADEPTSALDGQTARATIEILRTISKKRTVIVVTHDTSLIRETDMVFTLDKGELISKQEGKGETKTATVAVLKEKLSLRNAFSLTRINLKRQWGRWLTGSLSLLLAGVLLLLSFSGAVGESGGEEFRKLVERYGENLLDISIAGSFISAGGTDASEKEKPKADVTQDIGGLYEKYAKDDRVEYALFSQAFDEITITADGKRHQIKQSGNVPVFKKLVSGRIPDQGNEVMVPETFVAQSGKTNQSILGTTISFEASVYNWDSGKPVAKHVGMEATVVGVADTNASYEYDGQKMEYTIEDAFFFSRDALDQMRGQAGIQGKEINFLIRASTPAGLISLKNEINQQGIVPLGQFELVEDIVKLDTQTKEQSGSAGILFGVLAVVLTIAVFLVTGFMRRREYAIYQVSGYHTSHLVFLAFVEILLYTATGILLLLVASPLLTLATAGLFGISIFSGKMLITGALLIAAASIAAFLSAIIVIMKTDAAAALKTGDRS